MVILKSQSKEVDKPLAIVVILLSLFGLLAVFNASVAVALRDFGDKFYYLKFQALWLAIGILLMFLASWFDYRRLLAFSPILLIIALSFLVLVLLPSVGVKALGARRWLNFGPIVIQPTELAKLAFVLYSASFLAQKKDLWRFLLILAILVGLAVKEPDLGTAMVIAGSGILLYFVAGASILELALLTILGVGSGAIFIITSAYRRLRLVTLFNLMGDPLGASYHIRQILLALGSGGLTGLGLGQSRQKFEYLPEVATDSIFAVIAEEVGFLGATVLILAFLFLIVRMIKIAQNSAEKEGKLLAAGIASYLGVQTVVNLGAMVALLPLTGVPLPFISYGGSSLIVSLISVGIVLNISRQKCQVKK
jgi:cell division protein FtsW